MTYRELQEERRRTERIFTFAEKLFPGFDTPGEILVAYDAALTHFTKLTRNLSKKVPYGGVVRRAAYTFRTIRKNLEQKLSDFFRKSRQLLWSQLTAIRICDEFLETRQAIQEMIGYIVNHSRARYIDLPLAAQLYSMTHAAIQKLGRAQADFMAQAVLEGRDLVWV